MSTSRALKALLLAAGLASASGCVRSYASAPALSFQDLDYSSAETKKPWPLNRVALPKTAATYGLSRVPEMAYVDMPAAPGARTVVLVHGLGSYLKFWQAQLDVLSQAGYRVIAVDLPGFGKSDKPGTFPYTMEAMADAVRELTQGLGIEHPILVGHSMGGQTVLSYAIRYPSEPAAVVLVSPAGFEKFTPKEKAWFARVMSTEFIKTAPEYAIWGSVRQANFQQWRPELEWLIEERVRLSKAPEFDAYAYANVRSVSGLAHDDFVRDNLQHITAPTLILFGENDRLIPNPFMHGGFSRDIFEYGHAHIAGSKLVGFPGCGHILQLDCPGPFNAALTSFLQAVPAEKQE
ncbi:alpha/beta hydrolase [Corallococcus sp. H22C18031201]|uniref:alpha/beta fold hydrolase n=1 Tax=Citreicoccus inhibens TaxID=2849499 RepID=UPI000E742252|nr:alpha/beta hydrolase [Citreicoccus inhibens]MBU8900009.1 alpha/beta hydrolase [Citreicoccus inhibens]RJS20027.1 alpha/beta hydrolase [Corallococcus sp. H22C18031201]